MKMKVSLLDLKAQYKSIKNEINKAILGVVEGGNFILGENVKGLEDEIARYIGCKYAVGCASGTDALILSLRALGIGLGNEVITSPFTFFATATSITSIRAKPVFVDIEEKTYNINPKLIEKKITKRTKAIIPVHIYGQMANMSEILKIAKKHNLHIIEDACQAIGAEQDTKSKVQKAGNIGDIGCFSFFPSKNLGGYGDGGIITTNNKDIADKIKMLRVHGSQKRYYHDVLGYNSRLDEIQAAILRVKLKYLDNWNRKRIENAQYYDKKFYKYNLPIITPHPEDYNKHIYHCYAVRVKDRDKLVEFLKQQGISTLVHYPVPLHLQKALSFLGHKVGNFPLTEQVSDEILSLPMYPELIKEHINFVVEKIANFYS